MSVWDEDTFIPTAHSGTTIWEDLIAEKLKKKLQNQTSKKKDLVLVKMMKKQHEKLVNGLHDLSNYKLFVIKEEEVYEKDPDESHYDSDNPDGCELMPNESAHCWWCESCLLSCARCWCQSAPFNFLELLHKRFVADGSMFNQQIF